jgi:ATP-dependent DNA helicase RecG
LHAAFQQCRKNFCQIQFAALCLTSSTPSKEKKEILESLNSGEIKLIIGTHALLQSNVVFKNLGYIIIDEQPRFGVEQRAKLRLKGENTDLHFFIMTATPIPRSFP